MTTVHIPTDTALDMTWKTSPYPTVNAGGVHFADRELGPAGAPVVFLTHLAAVLDNSDSNGWTALPPKIGSSRSTIAVSAPPVGRRRRPSRRWRGTPDLHRALGLDQVDLFGFSLGGMIAQVIAQEEPRLVRKMIIAGACSAGGDGIDKVTRITYLDTARGLLTRLGPQGVPVLHQDPERARSREGLPGTARRAYRTTATRPSPCADSAPSSRPSTDGASRRPRTSRASTSRCSS